MSAANAGVADAEWDSALQRMGGHFLQSTLWQRVQAALGHDVIRSRDEGWMWAGAIRAGRFPRYMYLPHGPTSVSASALTNALEDAVAAARARSLDFVRAEPAADFATAALVASGALPTRSIQPRWTWVLDLTADEAELRRGLSAGHRGAINAAPRKGLTIRASSDPGDIEVFLRLQELTAAAGRFHGQGPSYHRAVAATLMPERAASLYIAEVGDEPVAAAMCFDFAGTRYYAHAVSDPVSGRRLQAAAPLVWRMILDARENGSRTFDFWGITPGGTPGHPWAGFSQFKRSFGGRAVERAGTWDLGVRAFRHRLYRAAMRLRR
ncbi:MAG: peptidoglycan bridge formation glycyltransferase FemA/FemB family protein [Candidatus Dormiibacterota bacterium]